MSVHKDETSAYHELLQQIGLGTMLENRRFQDMLITKGIFSRHCPHMREHSFN